MPVRRFFQVIVLIELAVCSQALAAKVISEDALQGELEHARILGPGAHFKVSFHGDMAVVRTSRLPGATDSDYKINAVLIAKQTMDFCGKQITKVRVIFSDPAQHNEILALIRQGDIKAYGSKLESKDELLSSIDLVRRNNQELSTGPVIINTPADVPPVMRQIHRHIDNLASRGVDVRAFQKMYDDLENLRKTGKLGKVAGAVVELREKLAEQEQAYWAAHRHKVLILQH